MLCSAKFLMMSQIHCNSQVILTADEDLAVSGTGSDEL